MNDQPRRLARQVLSPLKEGRSTRYQRYDWVTGRLGSEWSHIDSDRIVIAEGVYVSRLELRHFNASAVRVDTRPDSVVPTGTTAGVSRMEATVGQGGALLPRDAPADGHRQHRRQWGPHHQAIG
jgi:hypothetical protein